MTTTAAATVTVKIRKNGKIAVNGGATMLSADLRFLCGAYLTDEQFDAVKEALR